MDSIPKISIVRSNRKTIALHIEPDATLLVKAPLRMSYQQIETFIGQHADWIEKHLPKVRQRLLSQQKMENGYLFLGSQYILTPADVTSISIEKDRLLFPQALLFRREKEITSWYMNQAKKIITMQVEKYAKEMKTSYKDITFSDTRSQWGRCTHDNRLQFSWRLIMAPLLVLNYVVVHELTHTIEKNHTQLFWMKVRNINPSYRQQIKWLKDNGHALF